MPVYSMTGYANSMAQPPKAEDGSTNSQASVSVELRSVNGRFLDLSMRMPEELRGLEPQLRELVAARFKRGKIELRINTQREGDNSWPSPSPSSSAAFRGWSPPCRPGCPRPRA